MTTSTVRKQAAGMWDNGLMGLRRPVVLGLPAHLKCSAAYAWCGTVLADKCAELYRALLVPVPADTGV